MNYLTFEKWLFLYDLRVFWQKLTNLEYLFLSDCNTFSYRSSHWTEMVSSCIWLIHTYGEFIGSQVFAFEIFFFEFCYKNCNISNVCFVNVHCAFDSLKSACLILRITSLTLEHVSHTVWTEMMEMNKRIDYFLNFSDSINIKFILDESAFQGLSIGILFFSFYYSVYQNDGYKFSNWDLFKN